MNSNDDIPIDHLRTLESESISNNTNETVVSITAVSSSSSSSGQTIKPKLSRFQQALKNPFYVLFGSFLLALIYAILPDGNYWIYYYIKNQYWALMSLIESIEIMTINIPDVKETSYFLSYLFGFMIPMIIHLIAYYQGASIRNNIYVAALSGASTVVMNWIIYGIDCFLYPGVPTKTSLFDDTNNQQRLPLPTPDPSNKHKSFTLCEVATLTSRADVMTSARNKYRSMFVAIGESFSLPSPGRRSTFFSPSITTVGEDFKRRMFTTTTTNTLNPLSNTPTKPQNTFEIEENTTTTSSSSSSGEHSSLHHDKEKKSFCYYYLYELKYYFPRYWNNNHNNNDEMQCKEGIYCPLRINNNHNYYDRRIIWFYSLLFAILFCLNYFFLIIITINFRDDSNSLITDISLFLLFLIVTTIFRITMKNIGSILDSISSMNTQYKSTISMYFIAEVTCLLFYYTFYRILFRSIENFYEFFIFQFLHLLMEWFLYIIRTSYFFYLYTEWFILTYCYDWFIVQKIRFSFTDWQKFMTLDFAIRLVILLSSTYAMILLFLTIHYLPWIHSDLLQDDSNDNGSNDDDGEVASFEFTLLILGIALVIEVINAWIMNEYYFKPNHLYIDKEMKSCYKNASFGMLTLFIGVVLYINPIFALTNDTAL
eukprot:gene8505-9201_t